MTEWNQDQMDRQIQRLIDGELNGEEQVGLLRKIDEEAPIAWRTVALGYVEASVVRSIFEAKGESRAAKAGQQLSVEPSGIRGSRHENWGSRVRTAWVAAAAVIVGGLIGFGIRTPRSSPVEMETVSVAAEENREDRIPASFRAIESLDLALRDRGYQPVVSQAVYRTELPDGRRISLPYQRLLIRSHSSKSTQQ